MKLLFTSPDSAQMGLARSVLEASNIACEVRNESISQAIPNVSFASELWVDDENYEEAKRLLDEKAEP